MAVRKRKICMLWNIQYCLNHIAKWGKVFGTSWTQFRRSRRNSNKNNCIEKGRNRDIFSGNIRIGQLKRYRCVPSGESNKRPRTKFSVKIFLGYCNYNVILFVQNHGTFKLMTYATPSSVWKAMMIKYSGEMFFRNLRTQCTISSSATPWSNIQFAYWNTFFCHEILSLSVSRQRTSLLAMFRLL